MKYIICRTSLDLVEDISLVKIWSNDYRASKDIETLKQDKRKPIRLPPSSI